MVVEADLPHGDHQRVRQELLEPPFQVVPGLSRVVRMHARGGPQSRPGLRQLQGGPGGVQAVPDADDSRNARLPRPGQRLFPVRVNSSAARWAWVSISVTGSRSPARSPGPP